LAKIWTKAVPRFLAHPLSQQNISHPLLIAYVLSLFKICINFCLILLKRQTNQQTNRDEKVTFSADITITTINNQRSSCITRSEIFKVAYKTRCCAGFRV